MFYLEPSSNFMKIRKITKYNRNLPFFLYKIETKAHIKILRHDSLQIDVLNRF